MLKRWLVGCLGFFAGIRMCRYYFYSLHSFILPPGHGRVGSGSSGQLLLSFSSESYLVYVGRFC